MDAQVDENMRRTIRDNKDEQVRRHFESIRHIDANGVSIRLKGSYWEKFCMAYKEGGEIYYVKSGPQSWRELAGDESYLIIHNNKVTGALGISMN